MFRDHDDGGIWMTIDLANAFTILRQSRLAVWAYLSLRADSNARTSARLCNAAGEAGQAQRRHRHVYAVFVLWTEVAIGAGAGGRDVVGGTMGWYRRKGGSSSGESFGAGAYADTPTAAEVA